MNNAKHCCVRDKATINNAKHCVRDKGANTKHCVRDKATNAGHFF